MYINEERLKEVIGDYQVKDHHPDFDDQYRHLRCQYRIPNLDPREWCCQSFDEACSERDYLYGFLKERVADIINNIVWKEFDRFYDVNGYFKDALDPYIVEVWNRIEKQVRSQYEEWAEKE